MRTALSIAATILLTATAAAQSDNGLSGVWKLNIPRSEIRGLPAPPEPLMKLERKGEALSIAAGPNENGPFTVRTYPLDDRETKQSAGEATHSTRTKWEGAALLVNTLVSGPQNYTIMERWRASRDGNTLIVKRTIVRLAGESESVLVYERNPHARSVATAADPPPAARPLPPPAEYVVESGTRILLSLVSSVNTKNAAPGDRVYLQTTYPILSQGRVVVPPGSYVAATVTESRRAGRVKGKASLYLRFDSLTLPNGVTRDFRSRVSGIDADLDRAEGRIGGDGGKASDARTIGRTTAAGASVGSIAGRSAMGAGVGAAAGAAAGLIGVLGSRGADLTLPKGTTMEMSLDRELRFTSAELGPDRASPASADLIPDHQVR